METSAYAKALNAVMDINLDLDEIGQRLTIDASLNKAAVGGGQMMAKTRAEPMDG